MIGIVQASTADVRAALASGEHCAAGRRSTMAAQRLFAARHTAVINLDGGLDAWKSAGLPLIRLDPTTGQPIEHGRLQRLVTLTA